MGIDPDLLTINPSEIFLRHYCDDILNNSQKWMEAAIDWGEMHECLSSAESEDGLELVGIRVEWEEPLTGSHMFISLCPVEVIPDDFEGWWKSNINERCTIIGDIPDENQEFVDARLEGVGCTLRCLLDGTSVGSIQVFFTDEITLELGNGRFADPGIDEGWAELTIVVLGLSLLFLVGRALFIRVSSGGSFSNNMSRLDEEDTSLMENLEEKSGDSEEEE